MASETQVSQPKAKETPLLSVNGNGNFATNPLLPRLGQLGSPMLPIYPNITPPETQTTQFKSRFLPKHQKERSPLSPDRSISTARFSRNPFIAKASLSSLRENEESSSPLIRQKGNGGDKLTAQIQSFISRTDHVSNEWKNLGSQRATSVGPGGGGGLDFDDISMRLPLPAPARNANRASSVAPNMGRGDFYGDVNGGSIAERLNPTDGLKRRNTYHNTNGANPQRREFASPVRSPVRDFDYSFRNTPSVNPSVASRARRAQSILNGGGPSQKLRPGGGRFMSLEDECNWILSGREPLPNDLNGLCDPDDDSEADDNTLDDISGDELSEMTADLGEEHSAATLATERLEAEQAERMKLQKDNSELQGRAKHLQSANERMEMELMYSRGMDSINGEGYEGMDEGEHSSIFKQKYERAAKELEYTKQRLQQQHEDDLEQLVALKKQLEKKLNDAYEEVDEQRQVVAQWKRKTAKVQGEQNDLRMLLEEQTSRNALLEKRARKFDSELSMANEERKLELQSKEKLQRELDQLKSIKNQLEDQLQAMKLDLDFKDEKIGALNKELEELQEGGGASEEEVSSLKRQKHDLELRLKDQEEELDDLAGQVQMLEQAKTKLEMSMAAQKKEHRRELSSKDDELEDARTSTQKKVKVLEQQLESEHEERINFMREKHELETKIINLQELANRSADEEQVAKLKKDLKRTKALLKDAQLMIEKSRNESSNKVVLRQLKNQLEDTEFARMAAVKAKQNVELEVAELQQQLDDVMRNKNDVEDKLLRVNREKADFCSQLEDNEEEMAEVMKKYKASVAQLSVDQITIQQQASSVSDLEEERNKLKENLAELLQKIESLEGDQVSTAQHQRLELKIKELETKLELEQTTRGRMDTQINRLKEAIEKLNHECDSLRVKEATSQDQSRRLQRQLRDLKENYTTLQQKETEVNAKKNEFEKKLELAEAETVTARNDLKLALKRVEDLQQAINGELDSELDSLNSDADSDSSDELVGGSFMEHHRRAISVQRERESIARDISARESIQREVRASIARESVARQLHTMPEEPELKMSERLSSNPLREQDIDSSSDEEVGDRNITQRNEDSVQQNSIDGITEESQA